MGADSLVEVPGIERRFRDENEGRRRGREGREGAEAGEGKKGGEGTRSQHELEASEVANQRASMLTRKSLRTEDEEKVRFSWLGRRLEAFERGSKAELRTKLPLSRSLRALLLLSFPSTLTSSQHGYRHR